MKQIDYVVDYTLHELIRIKISKNLENTMYGNRKRKRISR